MFGTIAESLEKDNRQGQVLQKWFLPEARHARPPPPFASTLPLELTVLCFDSITLAILYVCPGEMGWREAGHFCRVGQKGLATATGCSQGSSP